MKIHPPAEFSRAIRWAAGASIFAAFWQMATAAEFHVSPTGDDTHPGTKAQPFATLDHARDAVRALKQARAGKAPEAITVWLHAGIHQPATTLVLEPQDSGSEHAPVRWCAAPGETPVVSGGRAIKGWQPASADLPGTAATAKGKIWVADIPKGWRFHYLYVDGQRMTRARQSADHWRKWAKDFSFGAPDKAGQMVSFKNKAQLAGLPANGDVEMVCIMAQYGIMGNGVLTAIDAAAGTARWNSKQLNLRPSRTNNERGYNLENALPFLDQPGEWCVDSAAGKVYLWPVSGTMENCSATAPKLYEWVRLQGDEAKGRQVHHVEIRGITFVCTDRLPENEWPESWLKRQWEHVDAGIYLQGVEDCTLAGNRILNSGPSGITLDHHCQRIRIEGNEIGWPGSNGIFLCGYGPGVLDVNKSNTVIRNWIHDTGQGNYWHSNAIQIYQSGGNRMALNLLERSSYSCLSIVGADAGRMSNPEYFFVDFGNGAKGQFVYNSMFNIRSGDFPKEIQDGVRAKTYKFTRDSVKPYLHSRDNLFENNIVIEPETLLDEGGAIYAWWCGKGNVWKDNLIFKSSGMPGSSIISLDDVAEYFTITGNVIWVEGSARCGTIGMRPNERGNVIKDNIRAAFQPKFADGPVNVNGIKAGFYTTDATRDPAYRLLESITGKTAGGWPGNPRPSIPAPGEPVKPLGAKANVKLEHITIE